MKLKITQLLSTSLSLLFLQAPLSVFANDGVKVEVNQKAYSKRAQISLDLAAYYASREASVATSFKNCVNSAGDRALDLDVPFKGFSNILKCAIEIEENVDLRIK